MAVIPLIIAHRGNSSEAPENTLPALEMAMQSGADMIEVDVLQSSDGIPVLLHDTSLLRTTSVNREIDNYTLADLKLLDAGSWYSPTFSGVRIPTLEEALKTVNKRVPLLIELKYGSRRFKGIEDNVVSLIRREGIEDMCIIQSFDDEVLNYFRKHHPGIRLQKLVTGNIPILPLHIDKSLRKGSIIRYKNVESINVNYRLVTKSITEKIHSKGRTIYAWTVNDEKDMSKMIKLGVDGIITDFPSRLKKIKEALS